MMIYEVTYKKLSDEGKMRFKQYTKLETESELFTEAMVQYDYFLELVEHIENEYQEPAYKKRREEDAVRAKGQKESYKEYFQLFKEIEEETAETFKKLESETHETQRKMVGGCINPYAHALFEDVGEFSDADKAVEAAEDICSNPHASASDDTRHII